jgi:hypothetical protein
MIEVLGRNGTECCRRRAICSVRYAKKRKEQGCYGLFRYPCLWIPLEESAAFDVEGYVVESVAGGESGAAIFEEGEAYEVVA